MASKYIPRVLLCGNVKKFLDETRGRDVDIVAKISFNGAAERGEFVVPGNASVADSFTLNDGDFKIFINGAEISVGNLRGLLNGSADYIVFTSRDEFLLRFRELYALKLIDRAVTVPTLMIYATNGFFSLNNDVKIFNLIHALNLPRTLDVDGCFAANDYQMFPDMNLRLEGVVENVTFPAIENFYSKIHRTLDDCKFRFYDALLLTAERSPENFIDTLIQLDDLSEKILTFVRHGSALENFLAVHADAFEKISAFPAVNGNVVLLKKFVRADFAAYIVTHKDAKLSALPADYRIIHAGHAQATETFGDVTDDIGDNISRLNLYLNEITALYWLWKNTSHAFIGFVHYRRFFTTSNAATFDAEKILTGDEAQEILRDYDIIVNDCKFGYIPLIDWKATLSTRALADYVIATVRKFIAARQPDYLDAYDRINDGFGTFCYEIFVARRKIFDAYCKWLFSFIIDATEEILATTDIASSDDPRIYRAVSFLAEHLLGVWLIKNRCRIKTLPIMFRHDV